MSQDESNRDVTGRRADEELPPELEAIEGELRSLRPRDDRLDRERLAFLAGQSSVIGRPTGRGAAARWAWPGACAGMTAVAAALSVALVVRPEPRVVERVRIVKVPVRAQVDESSRAGAHRVAAAPSDASRPASRSRVESRGGLARRLGRSGRPGQADWSRFGSRGEYLETLDRMLARGMDPWGEPGAESKRQPRLKASTSHAPPPYREWLKTMLDDQARVDRPTGPNYRGGSS